MEAGFGCTRWYLMGLMPQVQLPIFPAGVTPINAQLAFSVSDDGVVYLNGHLPVFTHDVGELAAFRLLTTQLIVNGTATQGEIGRAFGVSLTTVKRGVKRFRAAAFFTPPKPREGRKLTPELRLRAQALLDENLAVPAISKATGVLANTRHKALRAGRLVRRAGLEKKVPRPTQR